MPTLDRRVNRTRRVLADALVALILERGYERITVQDILDRADVGRSTFYAHYRDKESLLLAGFDDLRAELQAGLDGLDPAITPPDPTPAALVIFQHAHRHRTIYRAFCGRHGGQVVTRHLHRVVGDQLRAHLGPQLAAAGSALPVEVVAEFCASAALGLLTWWVDQDFPLDPAVLARMYGELAGPGLRAALVQPG